MHAHSTVVTTGDTGTTASNAVAPAHGGRPLSNGNDRSGHLIALRAPLEAIHGSGSAQHVDQVSGRPWTDSQEVPEEQHWQTGAVSAPTWQGARPTTSAVRADGQHRGHSTATGDEGGARGRGGVLRRKSLRD